MLSASVNNVASIGLPTLFETFVSTFGKTYESAVEKSERFEIFAQNVARIQELNAQNAGAQFDITQFTDMTDEESASMHGLSFGEGINTSELESVSLEQMMEKLGGEVPESLDLAYCYPSVRDQARCGSCWAFSTAAAVEGAQCVQSGKPIDAFLSPQTLVDCDKNQGGCNGASELLEPVAWALKNGLCLESEYPYKAKRSLFGCRSKKRCTKKVYGTKALDIKGTTESLKAAVAAYGTLSVGVGVSFQFQNYRSGVISEAQCGSARLNHAVALVGYGRTEEGQEFFKIRNSWGGNWGEQGHIRVAPGACQLGVLQTAVESIIEGANIEGAFEIDFEERM